jgi:hypothetical protein
MRTFVFLVLLRFVVCYSLLVARVVFVRRSGFKCRSNSTTWPYSISFSSVSFHALYALITITINLMIHHLVRLFPISGIPSYSQCLFSPPSYTLATLSCHILGLTKLGIGAPEYCWGGICCGCCTSGRVGISWEPEMEGFRGLGCGAGVLEGGVPNVEFHRLHILLALHLNSALR